MIVEGYENKRIRNIVKCKCGDIYAVEFNDGSIIPAIQNYPTLSPLDLEEITDEDKYVFNVLKQKLIKKE